MRLPIFSHPEFLGCAMTKLVGNVDAERRLFCLHFGRAAMLVGAGSGPSDASVVLELLYGTDSNRVLLHIFVRATYITVG